MWEANDTIGLISCIIGTVLLVIPLPMAIAGITWMAGGAATLVLGIVGVARGSKIGIGGIIIGAVLILIGIPYLVRAL